MRSMTGIGEFRHTEGNFDIHTSIRGVNHRFLQVYIKMPSCFNQLDERIRKMVSVYIHRGKIDISVDFISYPPETRKMMLNQNLLQDWFEYAKLISAQFQIPLGVDAEKMLRIPESLILLSDETSLELTWQMLQKTLEGALHNFVLSRENEGARLFSDFESLGNELLEIVKELPALTENQLVATKDRLKLSLSKLCNHMDFDPVRIEQELALASMKSDVSEEISRLKSHLKRYHELIYKKSAIGKELEFITQEMHREINTIGSKSCDGNLSNRVIDMKVIVEKIREQLQNIE